MSYWSHNPELYDEIIFKRMVSEGLASEDDDRPIYEIVGEFVKKPDSYKLIVEAERDYWSDMTDAADHHRESREDW